jgi:adenylate cyclase class IV
VEIELQYRYVGEDAEIVPIELAGFTLAESATTDILDTYWDTPALDLRRAGCSLRIRSAHDLGRAQLVWKGPARRRPDGSKERDEVEIPLDHVPTDGDELARLLKRFHLRSTIAEAAEVDASVELHAVGELRNSRSSHVYVQGLHRLELCWDRLTYPVGPPETRVEVEVKSESAARFLAAVDAELRELFGKKLESAPHGKSRELCVRLYPELLEAAA